MGVVLAFVASLFVRLLRATWRVRLKGPEPDYDAGPLVFCFWHGDQAGLLAHPRPRPIAVMTSLSRDGAFQAKLLGRLGFRIARGSASRGGATGLRELLHHMQAGADAAFAVDGPRGPLHRVKPGAVDAARRCGAKLVPVAAVPSRSRIFHKAWDRYELPLPFTQLILHRAPAIDPKVLTKEESLRQLKQALDGLSS